MYERIFEFRAWDKDRKKLMYERHFDCPLTAITEFFKWQDYVVQQYIGIEDCNKKKIFEGDIVALNLGPSQVYQGAKSTGLVIYDAEHAEFMIEQMTIGKRKYLNAVRYIMQGDKEVEDFVDSWHDATFYDYDGMEFDWKEIEVIGNMYDNPELIVLDPPVFALEPKQ
jgi:uncharacterized phage protein (TIGR01671 family)